MARAFDEGMNSSSNRPTKGVNRTIERMCSIDGYRIVFYVNTCTRRNSVAGFETPAVWGFRCHRIASTLARISRASASLSRGTRTLHQPMKFPLSWRAAIFWSMAKNGIPASCKRLFAKPTPIGFCKPVRIRMSMSPSSGMVLLPGEYCSIWCACSQRRGSGKQKPASGFRDGASKFAGGLDPFGDHRFGVGKGLLPRDAIGRAARQFRHFGDKRLVFLAPIENDLVFGHSAPSARLYRTRTL